MFVRKTNARNNFYSILLDLIQIHGPKIVVIYFYTIDFRTFESFFNSNARLFVIPVFRSRKVYSVFEYCQNNV